MTTEGQAPAGWYPVDDGRQRYWDGGQWTEHFAPGATQSAAVGVRGVAATVAGRLANVEQDDDPEALWQAVGKPITRIGAGRYKLTSHYLFFEKGTLSTDSQQVPISQVLDVDVRQTMTQKSRGLGSVTVHIQRAGGVEIVNLDDIPNFREGQRLINETALTARLAIQQRQNTSTLNYQGMPPVSLPSQTLGVPAHVGSGESHSNPIEQLRQLGELRDAGILTEDEFNSKKAEILSRL